MSRVILREGFSRQWVGVGVAWTIVWQKALVEGSQINGLSATSRAAPQRRRRHKG